MVLLPPLFAAAPVFWVGILVLNLLSFQLQVISVFPDGRFLSILVPSIVLALPLGLMTVFMEQALPPEKSSSTL